MPGAPGKAPSAIGTGLFVKISGVQIGADKKPVVTATLTDAGGRPLPPESLEGFGFTIAQLVVDEATQVSRYQSLLVHEVVGKPYTVGGETKPPALAKTTQAFADSGGAWTHLGEGKYTYTFTNTLASEVNPALTTVVGVYAWKDGRATVVNDVFTFVPAGGQPAVTREVVTTAACQTCHNPLQAHGGVRRDTALCVTCHTDQTTDPETGNSVEFKVLIHRLHSGSHLPSVQAGTPYQIVGFQQTLLDFSKSTWPQDTRNCLTCHRGGPQSDNFKTAPDTAACTSCHDNVNTATGENHPGGKEPDTKCAICHIPDGDEFDTSITGAHVIQANSSQIKGVKLEIVKVEGMTPGGSPTVTFKISNNAGQPLVPADMGYLAVTLAGPTTDYVNRWTEIIASTAFTVTSTAEDAGGGAFRYTFKATLPQEATGTYAVGMEAFVMEILPGIKDPVRVAAFNPVTYTSLTGSEPVARREVVDREKCNACHKSLALHGGIRQNTDYCVMCHSPTGTDEASRPKAALPPATINFRELIHRIHRGGDATQPLQVYGYGSQLVDFSAVVFPGKLSACDTCHLPGTYGLPLPRGVQPTTIVQAGTVVSTTLPVRAVCTACHDSSAVSEHVELQTTAAGVETCDICHGTGRKFDATTFHSR